MQSHSTFLVLFSFPSVLDIVSKPALFNREPWPGRNEHHIRNLWVVQIVTLGSISMSSRSLWRRSSPDTVVYGGTCFRFARDDAPVCHHYVDHPEGTVKHNWPCPSGGDRRQRRLPGPGPDHVAEWGSIRLRHLLLRSSTASEGGGGAWMRDAILHLTLPPSPEETGRRKSRNDPRPP